MVEALADLRAKKDAGGGLMGPDAGRVLLVRALLLARRSLGPAGGRTFTSQTGHRFGVSVLS